MAVIAIFRRLRSISIGVAKSSCVSASNPYSTHCGSARRFHTSDGYKSPSMRLVQERSVGAGSGSGRIRGAAVSASAAVLATAASVVVSPWPGNLSFASAFAPAFGSGPFNESHLNLVAFQRAPPLSRKAFPFAESQSPLPAPFSSAASARGRAMSSSASSETGTDGASGEEATLHPLGQLAANFDHSWITQLDAEDDESRTKARRYSVHSPTDDSYNRSKRPVFNGHYVPVKPTQLRNPRLVVHSGDMARRLGLTSDAVQSEEFARFFSGDTEGAGTATETWATPYALSIMGTRYTSNCPFGTGDGYGDGRAISIGEVKVSPTDAEFPAAARYELQLKGGGPTPFCRGADGRAVLRSSIREFLASEAMHHLGISTTRALSLVVSEGPGGNTSQRPWYSDDSQRTLPSMDDPRLAQYSDAQKRQVIAQLKVQARDNPDVMIEEPCAITCRVSPSFVRVGHLDLFSRRATGGNKEAGNKTKYDTSTPEWEALEKLIWHAAYREFPNEAYLPNVEEDDLGAAARALLRGSLEGIATMVTQWVRVGFTQGNFNADNCLVGGRTMDYGPFGFVDEYHPLYAKWTGSGEHFGFLNQPQAGFTNFSVLVDSVLPVIHAREGANAAAKFEEELMAEASATFQRKVDEVFRVKMGFHPTDGAAADELWQELEPLFRQTKVDWTMFWRRLYEVTRKFPVAEESKEYGDMLKVLMADDCKQIGSSPFYEELPEEYRAKYLKWIRSWREALVESYGKDGGSAKKAKLDAASVDGKALSCEERMRLANPKYILRENTLVEAYNRAARGDEYMVKELLELVEYPYDEGSEDQIKNYYRRAPDEALSAGGTAYMS